MLAKPAEEVMSFLPDIFMRGLQKKLADDVNENILSPEGQKNFFIACVEKAKSEGNGFDLNSIVFNSFREMYDVFSTKEYQSVSKTFDANPQLK